MIDRMIDDIAEIWLSDIYPQYEFIGYVAIDGTVKFY